MTVFNFSYKLRIVKSNFVILLYLREVTMLSLTSTKYFIFKLKPYFLHHIIRNKNTNNTQNSGRKIRVDPVIPARSQNRRRANQLFSCQWSERFNFIYPACSAYDSVYSNLVERRIVDERQI